MTDLQMWSFLVGALAPLLIAVLQQPTWGRPLRALVGLVVIVLLALGTCYFQGDFEGRSIVSSLLVLLVTAYASYGHFWKPTGIAPGLESATSPGHPVAVAE